VERRRYYLGLPRSGLPNDRGGASGESTSGYGLLDGGFRRDIRIMGFSVSLVCTKPLREAFGFSKCAKKNGQRNGQRESADDKCEG